MDNIEGYVQIAGGLKYMAVGLAMIALGPVGLGIANIFSTLIAEISRNPANKGLIFTYALIGFALTEATALYALVMGFIMLFS